MQLLRFKQNMILIALLCSALNGLAQSKPNIILILADDLGYGDLGCYGQQMIKTPNIDALAAQGIKFSDYYAGSTVCAPSRESLLTGVTTGRTFIRGNFLTDEQEDPAMPSDKKTIAEYLKKAGYLTALYGKWGLGGEGHGPETQGFDSSFCYLDQIKAHEYYPPYLYENGKRVYISENKDSSRGIYSHDLFEERTMNFISHVPKDQPFFLYLPYTIPHGGYTLPPEEPYKSKNWSAPFKVYATMISKLDSAVGHIVKLLQEKGLADNTIIFFTSDNGANLGEAKFFKSNGPFRDGKRFLYDGGIREPLIAYWPGKIKPGQISAHVTAAWDFMPTLCNIARINAPDSSDGISFLPTLRNQSQKKHEFLYWEYYQYNYNWYKPDNDLPRNYLTNRAIRYGKWKAVQNNIFEKKNASIELYDITTDKGEKNNIAKDHPDIVNKANELFSRSSQPDAPFFPYVADSLAKLHLLSIHSASNMKQFFHYQPNHIPFVSSHRGAPTLGYPENCISTFMHTIRHTWSIMEIDPHYTKDSAIILMHDPTLERTSNGHGKISDYSLDDLKKLNLKDPMGHLTRFKIPTLDEALEWAKGKTVLILDQKDVSAEARAKKIIAHHAQSCAMIMCYTFQDAQKVYALDKDIMMEVFIPNRESGERFEKTGVPWSNVVAFVTHKEPSDTAVFKFLHDRGVMAIRGSSRNIDKSYLADEISKADLDSGYVKMIRSGADIIEADLGVQAGKALEKLNYPNQEKSPYFKYETLFSK